MFNANLLFHTAVLSLAMSSATNVFAGDAFGNPYKAVGPVSVAQAQVVFYRPTSSAALSTAANVYVDQEFHAALLPGGYSTLCVAAGVHSLSAALDDAPQYKAKTADGNWFTLAGGNTYFLRVDEDASKTGTFVKRDGAERELAHSRQQIQTLSRASAAQACASQVAGAGASVNQ